jgi:cell division protein FtsB
MRVGEWVNLGALCITSLAVLFAYLRRPPLVPAGDLDRLRQTLQDMRDENVRLTGRITYLEAQVETLRGESRWWQEEWRKLKDELDKIQERR